MYIIIYCISTEDIKPTMKDLNRYVVRKHADKWFDTGIELGIDSDILNVIDDESKEKSTTGFQKTLQKWLKLNTDDVTWKALEVALTNVNRMNLGLEPVDDIYGENIVKYYGTARFS